MSYSKLKMLPAILVMAATGVVSSHAANADSVLDKVVRDKKIIVGTRESAPPYAYIDAQGNWVGWSLDLSRALHGIIEQKLDTKLELEFKPVTPQTRIPLVVNGTVDWVLGTTGNTIAREDVIDFSLINNAVCVKKLVPVGSDIHASKDMAGKRIGVTKGSVEERLITSMGESGELNPPAQVVTFDKHSTGFIALSQGKTDAHVTLDDTLLSIASKSPNPEGWEVRGPDLFCTPNGILLQENDSNWRDTVNQSLCYFIVTGGYDKLYDEWFAGDAPKAGYKRVQSAELKTILKGQCPYGSEAFLTKN